MKHAWALSPEHAIAVCLLCQVRIDSTLRHLVPDCVEASQKTDDRTLNSRRSNVLEAAKAINHAHTLLLCPGRNEDAGQLHGAGRHLWHLHNERERLLCVIDDLRREIDEIEDRK